MSDPAVFHLSAPPVVSRASATARIALFMYGLLIVYASWFPFSGWRAKGLAPWAYFSEHMPRYWTWFDLIANVIGYIPFGALIVLALYPLLRGLPAMLVASLSGIMVAALMEAVQTYLPSRVPSNLDLLTNTIGVVLGAGLGALALTPLLEKSRLRTLREKWFSDQASRGLIVVGLWPLAQLYPQAFLFGHGQVLPVLSGWLSELLTEPVELTQLLWDESSISVEQYLLSESIIAACGLTGAVLTLLCQMRSNAPRTAMAMLLVIAAIAAKATASAILFTPENAFTWLTPSAAGGLIIGAVMLAGLSLAPAVAQRRAAIAALLIGLMVLNVAPSNPYFLSTLQDWVQGKFLNFNGAAQFLSLAWPFLALWFLTHRTHQAD